MKKILILIAVFTVFLFPWHLSKDDFTGLNVVFLDVGQGDSIFIRTPSGQNIIIDGGPDNQVLYELPGI
jgi:competence protein ComEC